MDEAQTIETFRQMFASYGLTATPERCALYAETVGEFTAEQLRAGIRDAMREVREFPPGPGTVRRCVLAVARMRPGDPVEMPLDLGPRLGPGASPAAALVSGLERRVCHTYAEVVARAAVIRAARRLPDTLDARLWSLGEAEVELGYVDTPIDQALERSLRAMRAECGRRLGVTS